MKKFFSHVSSSLLTFFYPSRCPLCEAWSLHHDKVCETCVSSLHPLPAAFTAPILHRVWFQEARSAVAYEGKLIDAIWNFKYHERFDLLPFFTHLLFKSFPEKTYDLMLPVPLHQKKLAKRGFNQAGMLVQSLSARIGVPHDLFLLERRRATETQVRKEVKEREENVRDAFAIKLSQKNVLLIDDVITTGATVNECAKALIKGGVQSVDVLTIARPL